MAKKYIKLKGHEKPTPESERRARAFMQWYASRMETLRNEWLYEGLYDDEVATDAALYIYNSIALKGLQIKGKYKWYYLRAYHMRLLAEKKKRQQRTVRHVCLDDENGSAYQLPAPAFDYNGFETAVGELNSEMMAYVRENYPALQAAIFEIYIALQPQMSYQKLSAMLGLPAKIFIPTMVRIRRDLAEKFAERHDYLLTLV